MCDPVTLALASTAASVIGTAGSFASSMGAMKAQKKQAANVNAWQREQKTFRDQEVERQEQLRQEANRSREAGLQQLGGENQQKAQEDEAARLMEYIAKGDPGTTREGEVPVSAADAVLSGQAGTGTAGEKGDVFQTDLAAKLNEAVKASRAKMQQAASVGSFGSSFGGLGRRNQGILQRTGADIDMFNNLRGGSSAVFGVERGIDPVEVQAPNNTLGDAFSTIGGLGFRGLGNAIGKGGNPWGTTVPSAPGNDPWANLRHTTLPAYAPVPTQRPIY